MLYGQKEVTFSPRLLPERSYLYYKYPQRSTERSIEFYLPILENLEISETQRPNLGVYDILGRAGNLFSYHGSKSREFSLKFFITLPNVIDHINNVGLNAQFSDHFRYFYSERDFEKRKFFIQSDRNSESVAAGNNNGVNYYNESLSKYSSFLPPANELDSLLQQLSEFTNALKIPVFENPAQILNLFKKERPRVVKNAVNYFMLLINVIRTSTVNNSSNTSLSPPTIYINHGTMYNNIPCVCTNYNLRIVSENGYELKNLNPRRVEVTLNLSENRTGNFGQFIPWTTVKGDLASAENLAGWEAIISNRTMDPWNSTFGEYDTDLINVTLWEEDEANKAAQLRARQEEVSQKINSQPTPEQVLATKKDSFGPAGPPLGAEGEIPTESRGGYNPPMPPPPSVDSVAATVAEQRAILETQGYEGITRTQLTELEGFVLRTEGL